MKAKRTVLYLAGLIALHGVSLEEAHAKAATTVNLPSTGSSAIDQVKEHAKQFSYSLRQRGDRLEGRVEAPGLYEFSSFFSQKNENTKERVNENIEKLRTSTISSIQKLLKQPTSPAQRVDLLLRLAELHAERHSYFLKKEMDTYEVAYDKWDKSKRVGMEPRFLQNQSLQALTTATQILRDLVNQYPNHPRIPDALYQLGFLLTEMKSESALLYFQRLIERFPKSKFIPDAHLAIGEFHFNKNKFNEALLHYQKVLQDRENRSYPYAVYKLGWTFFNIRGTEEETTKNLQKSLIAFKLLVKLADEASGERKLGPLKKDALRDIVLVFAELGDVDEAQAYFKSIKEPELYHSLLERLAWLHTEAGRHKEAAGVYSRLIEEFPINPKNPQFLMRLAGLYEKENRRDQLIETLKTAAELTSLNSNWSRSQKNPRTREESAESLLKEINVWNVRLHAEFQKTKTKKTALESLQLYDLSLNQVLDTPSQFLTHFNRAQLLTSLDEHDKAVDGYIRATLLDKKFSLRRNESKIALENAMAESEILIAQRGAASSKPIQLQALEARYIRIIDLHATLFPRDPERLANQHRAALMLFQAEQIALAAKRWIMMAKEMPSSPFVNDGLRLLIKKSFDAQDWIKAAQDTKLFLSIPGIAQAPVGQHLSKLQKVAQFQQGLALENGSRHTEAAQIFLDFQKSFPSDQDAPKALINAANNQFKANRPDAALGTLENFVRQYPASEHKTKALEMMSSTAEGMGRFAYAASALEQLAGRIPHSEIAAQKQLRAAELRLAEGNTALAITNIQNALPNLKRSGEVCEAFKTLLDAQTQANSSQLLASAKMATQKCQTVSPEWGIFFAGYAARLSYAIKDFQEASRLASLALSRGKLLQGKLQNPFSFEGLRMAGAVQLEVLESKSRLLIQKRISHPNKINSEFSAIKTEAQSLAQQFVQLAQSGQPETAVGALYRVAEIQESLAFILLQTPNPNGGSAADDESFRSKIEKIALPLQEEASELYAQALERAHEAETLTPYNLMLKEKLALIRPGDYRKPIETVNGSSHIFLEEHLITTKKD